MRAPFALPKLNTAILIGGVCSLAVAVGVRVWQGTQARELLSTAPRAAALAPLDLGVHPTNNAMALIQDAALFHAGRKFFSPRAASAATPPRPSPNYQLAGTFTSPQRGIRAFLKSLSGGSMRTVGAGDILDGWVVRTIERDRVLLQYEHEQDEILDAAPGANPGGLAPGVGGIARGAGMSGAGSFAKGTPGTPSRAGTLDGNTARAAGYLVPGKRVDATRLYQKSGE
jgi:hypothetical protein